MAPRPQPTLVYGQVSSRNARSEIRRSMPAPTSAAQATSGRPRPSPIRNPSAEPSPSRHWAQRPVSPSGDDSPAGVAAGAAGSRAFPMSTAISRSFERKKARNFPARDAMTRFEAGAVGKERGLLREAARLAQEGSRWRQSGWVIGLVAVLLAGVLACRLGSSGDSIASLIGDVPVVVSSKAELKAALEVAGIRARDKHLEKAWSTLAAGDSDGRGRGGSLAARLLAAGALLNPGGFSPSMACSALGVAAGFALVAISALAVRSSERERVAGANRASCTQVWGEGNQGGDVGGG